MELDADDFDYGERGEDYQVSQITYVSTVLDIEDTIMLEIQDMINSFIVDIKTSVRHWISKELLYESTQK